MLSYKTEIRVRYADTDQMQFVYNGKYLEYFEVARTEMLRNNGLPYRTLEEQGYMLPLLEAYVKYNMPAYYDDLLTIEAKVIENPVFLIHIDYEITRNNEPEIIAQGFTKHVFINKTTKKAVRPPKLFVEAMKQFYK